MSLTLAEFAVALYGIYGAAWIGNDLGAAIRRHDEPRWAAREAVETVIVESDAYRAYARRKVWAA